MIANFVKVIAPVAVVVLAVSGPAIAKDKQPKADAGATPIEKSQGSGDATGTAPAGPQAAGTDKPADGQDKAMTSADDKVIEMNIPPKDKDASDGKVEKSEKVHKSPKDQKSAKAKKPDDKRKDPKKDDKKKDNG